jgi:hypothetical protein
MADRRRIVLLRMLHIRTDYRHTCADNPYVVGVHLSWEAGLPKGLLIEMLPVVFRIFGGRSFLAMCPDARGLRVS